MGRQQERKNETRNYKSHKMLNKMALVTFYLSITALNINGLNSLLNKDTKLNKDNKDT